MTRFLFFVALHTLYSDKEAATLSQKFQDKIHKAYGIKFRYLSKGSKAFLAELFIRRTKYALETALEGQDTTKDRFAKFRWVRLLPSYLLAHNNEFANGSKFRRNEITVQNFNEYIDSLERSGTDSTILNSSRSIDQRSFSSEMKKKLFKFQVGDYVRVAAKSLKDHKGLFRKISREGTFSRQLYTVSQAMLHSTRDNKLVQGMYGFRIPVFSSC